MSHEAEMLEEIREIRRLLLLVAEPAIAQRDAKLRAKLRELVGASTPKRKSIFLMNGKRRQANIVTEAAVHKGQLSVLVKELNQAGLLTGDPALPSLAISIPENFFEASANAE